MAMAFKVLRTGFPPHVTEATLPEERQILAAVGAELIPATPRTEAELQALVPEMDGLLIAGTRVSAAVIAAMPKCRGIVTCTVGFDHIDVAAATERGIPVAHVPDFCTRDVANHTLMFLLAGARKLVPLTNAMRQGRWDRTMLPPMPEIYGQTLGLIGFGRIARAVAARAKAFEMEILAYDPYVEDAVVRRHGATPAPLDRLLPAADFVSVHTFLDEKTRHLIGEREFRLMKPTAFFINTCRGSVVDEQALIRALREGWIAGAGLDVFEQEPIDPANPLLRLPNVLLTPHSAGYSNYSVVDARRKGAAEMARLLRGRWPEHLVNPSVKAQPRFAFAD
jgi:D-3-phosphoglycerate dehydrogenase